MSDDTKPVEDPLDPKERPKTRVWQTRANALIKAIESGMTNEAACKVSGMTRTALYYWLKRGDDQEARHVRGWSRDFRDRYRAAEAKCEERLLGLVSNAAEQEWQAASWILERRFPKKWSHRVHVVLQSELNDALQRLEQALPPAQYAVALAAIAGSVSGDGSGAPGAAPDEPGDE